MIDTHKSPPSYLVKLTGINYYFDTILLLNVLHFVPKYLYIIHIMTIIILISGKYFRG